MQAFFWLLVVVGFYRSGAIANLEYNNEEILSHSLCKNITIISLVPDPTNVNVTAGLGLHRDSSRDNFISQKLSLRLN